MENKAPSQNIQDVYLNTVRRDKAPVTVFLISGVKLIGKIKGFDKYSVILEANNQEQLIFKHPEFLNFRIRGASLEFPHFPHQSPELKNNGECDTGWDPRSRRIA